MKTLYPSTAALVLFAILSGAAYAEGSKIEKSTLINASQNINAINAAIGRNSTANTGSISIRDSDVKESTSPNINPIWHG